MKKLFLLVAALFLIPVALSYGVTSERQAGAKLAVFVGSIP
jgi:hypothetical protein